MTHDLLIRNGRVMDPETGFDEVCDVAVKDGTIVAVGKDLGGAAEEIDATGLVVAPGFIDIHAHGQTVAADRMQAFDGVTTALELEVGVLPVAEWYDDQATRGRPLNYGAAASWISSRRAVMSGFEPTGKINPVAQMGATNDTRWHTDTATGGQVAEIVGLTRQGLDEGAIGIGIPNGYVAGAGLKELTEICDLAAEFGRPTFTHVANASNIDPKSSVESYVKLIGLAGATGAHMHICHLNSTSLLDIDRSAELIRKAQEQGLPVTTEAYPYGAGSTVVGAGFFAEEEFTARTGSPYSAVELVKNGHRFEDRADLLKAGHENPSDLIIWHFLDIDVNEEHRRMLDVSVLFPGGSIASDAMPWIKPDGSIYDGDAWPLPDDAVSHPRSSGTFTKFLHDYVTVRGAVTLMEGLAKCTLYPAQVIESCAPQIARKARLREGFDADIVVFDAETLSDQATFTEMNKPAIGVEYLIVGGTKVIAGGELDTKAAPGQAIRCPQAA
ncbi:amidohydrolase family protein [Chachezhania sediminis]|uniref:amidohydrolase family protein n=1 Tax=Chachezhania sediminis TaxID=2599291 RepID=UPI00131BD8C9|nr:amidohydrolase family protein [Chachezhania sediminis]